MKERTENSEKSDVSRLPMANVAAMRKHAHLTAHVKPPSLKRYKGVKVSSKRKRRKGESERKGGGLYLRQDKRRGSAKTVWTVRRSSCVASLKGLVVEHEAMAIRGLR